MSVKRVFIALLVACSSIYGALSQEYHYIPFPDSNAVWSEVYYPGIDAYGDPLPAVLERFAIPGGDTIIDTLTYKKLYIFYDTVFNVNRATCVGGIREDDQKRVFFKGDSMIHFSKPMNEYYGYKEIMLYDFSLEIGDTIKNINCRPEDDIIIVNDIDTVLVGNTLRKRFHFKYYTWVQWVEGIGNLRGLLFTSGEIPNNGMYDDLICFKQNDTLLYFNDLYIDCIPPITGIKARPMDDVPCRVYPNPATGNNIEFDLGDESFKTIDVIDGNGLVIDKIDANGQSHLSIPIEKYPPGLYFYKAANASGIKYTGKFVVQ
jgi:hypothetical protein